MLTIASLNEVRVTQQRAAQCYLYFVFCRQSLENVQTRCPLRLFRHSLKAFNSNVYNVFQARVTQKRKTRRPYCVFQATLTQKSYLVVQFVFQVTPVT